VGRQDLLGQGARHRLRGVVISQAEKRRLRPPLRLNHRRVDLLGRLPDLVHGHSARAGHGRGRRLHAQRRQGILPTHAGADRSPGTWAGWRAPTADRRAACSGAGVVDLSCFAGASASAGIRGYVSEARVAARETRSGLRPRRAAAPAAPPGRGTAGCPAAPRSCPPGGNRSACSPGSRAARPRCADTPPPGRRREGLRCSRTGGASPSPTSRRAGRPRSSHP